jgi:triphosphoribosyl-dephospho-CoA synthase
MSFAVTLPAAYKTTSSRTADARQLVSPKSNSFASLLISSRHHSLVNFSNSKPFPFDRSWNLPEAVALACQLEASAAKLGNVHPQASFADMSFAHFAAGAIVTGNCFQETHGKSVGELILDAVTATRQRIGCNTNLGTLLLFGPIAKAFENSSPLKQALQAVLEQLTKQDSERVYAAIRVAHPGGLGQREKYDIDTASPPDLLAAMAEVRDFDAVARQYTNNFGDIFDYLLPWLDVELARTADVLDAICRLQLRWLSHEPDGLIVRKLGKQAAMDVQARAVKTWKLVKQSSAPLHTRPEYLALDAALRDRTDDGPGNPLNPGTTADLIAAALLIKLLQLKSV